MMRAWETVPYVLATLAAVLFVNAIANERWSRFKLAVYKVILGLFLSGLIGWYWLTTGDKPDETLFKLTMCPFIPSAEKCTETGRIGEPERARKQEADRLAIERSRRAAEATAAAEAERARKISEADVQRKAAEAKAARDAVAKSQKLEDAQKAEAERQRVVLLDQQRKQDAMRQKAETEAKKKAELSANRPVAAAGTNVLVPPAAHSGPNSRPEQSLPDDWLPLTMANLRSIRPNAEYGYWIEGISIAAVPRFENMIINRSDDISSMTCEASCRNDKGCVGAYYVRLVRGNDQCVLLSQLPPLMYVEMMRKNTITNSKLWLKPTVAILQRDVLTVPAKKPDPGIGGCEGLPGETKVWVSPFGPDQCWQPDRNLLSYKNRQQ